MKRPIKTIGFDADDTLWHNENLFEEHHRKYCELLSRFHDAETVEQTLFQTEMNNLADYGYGIKSFTLSSIETAIALTDGAVSSDELRQILDYGKAMLRQPVELLPEVAETIQTLAKRRRLILITKGDLRDQERKIANSGLGSSFEHAQVVSEKDIETYRRVLRKTNTDIDSFLMVGNSLKSDILPILELGGRGVYIPYRLTWEHERVSEPPQESERFFKLESIKQLPDLLDSIS